MTGRLLAVRLFGGAASWRFDRRVPAVAAIFVVALLATAFVGLLEGEFTAPVRAVLQSLSGGTENATDLDFVVMELRLPRIVLAVLVGAAFGLSGALMQAIVRNPLADPGILGINSGAALAGTLVIVSLQDVPAWLLPWIGFAGAVATTAFIYLFAWRGGIATIRLILVGIGVAALLGSFTTLVTAFGEIRDVQRALVWLAGSLYGRGWTEVSLLAAWLGVLGPLAWLCASRLDAIALGDESAVGLGLRLEWTRAFLVIVATGLAAAAVSAAGTLGFVGLVAPHVSRRLVGSRHAGLLPVAALTGALLVLAADLVGRTIVAPAQLPAGIVTAIVGAPYFLYLLWTRVRA